MVNEIPLTIAFSDYDHVRDLVDGRVRTPGIRPTFLDLTIPEIFARFSAHREWHVSEFGLGKYVAHLAAGDESLTAIPVFPSRMFRLTAFYVRTDSALSEPRDLIGKRVGLPEWAQTAGIYARGWLVHHAGVALTEIEWFQAGVNEPGRKEKVAIQLPAGVTCTPRPDSTLNDMLLSGEVDAILTAQAPLSYAASEGRVRRLLSDARQLEEKYWRSTSVLPIMHTVAIRRDLLDQHPWVAANLLTAFDEAKRRSVERALDWAATRFPIPWVTGYAEEARGLFDGEYWPYGLEPNRPTLEAFLRYAHEQGITARLLQPDELFTPTTHAPVRV